MLTPPFCSHLDLEAIDGLARAINNYAGGLVLVSHDFRLIDAVAKEIWVCDKKTVSVWKGDIRCAPGCGGLARALLLTRFVQQGL